MKTLIPLLSLVILASCNDSVGLRSTIPRESNSISPLSTKSALSQGQIFRVSKTGTTMSPIVLQEGDTLEKHEVHSETFAVVLKTENSKYYEYQEIRDIISDKVSRKVTLKNIPTEASYKNFLNPNSGVYKLTNSARSTLSLSSAVKIKFRQEVLNVISVQNINCDKTLENEEYAVIYRDGIQQSSEFASAIEKTSCGGTYTKADLADINLDAIQFCDETSNTAECSTKNLNALKPKI